MYIGTLTSTSYIFTVMAARGVELNTLKLPKHRNSENRLTSTTLQTTLLTTPPPPLPNKREGKVWKKGTEEAGNNLFIITVASSLLRPLPH